MLERLRVAIIQWLGVPLISTVATYMAGVINKIEHDRKEDARLHEDQLAKVLEEMGRMRETMALMTLRLTKIDIELMEAQRGTTLEANASRK